MAMSVVTDVVFVSRDRADSKLFTEIVGEFYRRRSGEYVEMTPLESCDHAAFCQLFYLGVDYADDILLNNLRGAPWTGHTVLWIEGELYDGPDIKVDGKTVRKAKLEGSWWGQ
jgi:hypothetical protein